MLCVCIVSNMEIFQEISIVSMVFRLWTFYKWKFPWKFPEISTRKFPKWKFPFLNCRTTIHSLQVRRTGTVLDRTSFATTPRNWQMHCKIASSARLQVVQVFEQQFPCSVSKGGVSVLVRARKPFVDWERHIQKLRIACSTVNWDCTQVFLNSFYQSVWQKTPGAP